MVQEVNALHEEIQKCLKEISESGSSAEFKAVVSNIKIDKARELTVEQNGKKAVLISVAYKSHEQYVRPNLQKLVAELEKKTKAHVIFVATRTIQPKHTKRAGMVFRPRSRTLTAVQESMLEDIVAPIDIVGKRTRVGADGKKLLKVYLDSKDSNKDNVEEKLATYAKVYGCLTSKQAVFQFAEHDTW